MPKITDDQARANLLRAHPKATWPNTALVVSDRSARADLLRRGWLVSRRSHDTYGPWRLYITPEGRAQLVDLPGSGITSR